MKLRQADTAPVFTALVYGAEGSGKTSFIGSFQADPRTSPVLLFNSGGNPDRVVESMPGMVVVDIDNYADLFDLPLSFFRQGQPAEHRFRKVLGIGPDIKFKTVALDTLTELQAQIKWAVSGKKLSPALAAEGPRLQINQWGDILDITTDLARFYFGLRQHGIHVIITTQQRVIDVIIDAETAEAKEMSKGDIKPFLQGGSQDLVPPMPPIEMYLTRKAVRMRDGTYKPVVTAHFEPGRGGDYRAKNQLSDKLGSSIVDPTATKIFDLLGGNSNE